MITYAYEATTRGQGKTPPPLESGGADTGSGIICLLINQKVKNTKHVGYRAES